MKLRTFALAACVGPLACGDPGATEVERHAPQALGSGEVFEIGVMIDAASPALANFTAAANLAESQLNQGMQQAGSAHRFDVLVTPYTAGQEQDTAIDLVNNRGALGLVADGDWSAASINRLNYEFFNPRLTRNTPVTCFGCSSPRFNQTDTDLGFMDPDFWLMRTYFNAGLEPEVMIRMAMARPDGGDFDGDGHFKVVVYFDVDSRFVAFNAPVTLDAVHPGAHSMELVFKSLPSTPESRAEDMARIFDTDPEGHAPDLVMLLFTQNNMAQSLADYTGHPVAARPPAFAPDTVRRDHMLPALLAAGGATLEGTSVLRVSDTSSGPMFRTAFQSATGGSQPEVTAAYLYDAIVMHAGAIGWAFHFGSLDPFVIQGNFANVNDPSGRIIRPRVQDYRMAIQRINQDRPINYDGAGSSVDLDFTGENFPPVVHWKIVNSQFVELERYSCNPANGPAACQPL